VSPFEIRIHLNRGDFSLDLDASLPDRGVTCVFGPSGCGKSTLLRCIAGLERGVRGLIRLGETVWLDSAAHHSVPPHRRLVGYVFQEADLFRHLSIRDNLRYGFSRAAHRRIGWDDAVRWLGLAPLLDRSPAGLSGGERQRVAIARALLASPRLLLMDEPLAALDEVNRREILPYLESIPRRLEIPIVYVSHSLREVLRLSDHVLWMEAGRIRASGAADQVVRDLGFVDWQGSDAAVVLDATVREHDLVNALTVLDGPWGTILTRSHPDPPGTVLRIQVRASDVSLGLQLEERSSILNQFPLSVLAIDEVDAGEVLVSLHGEGSEAVLLARITRFSAGRLGLMVGESVYARVKSVAILD
jgi:molybdate transport system ATP-binding protein